jgi:hypothetical protein
MLSAASTGCGSDTKQPSSSQPAEKGTGISYIHDTISDAPWSIHVVKVSRARSELQFETTLGAGKVLGMSVVSDQVKTIPLELGRPMAAINGDFFKSSSRYPGDPEGVQIVHGELVSAPNGNRSCFWVDSLRNPRITNVQSQFKVTLPDGRSAPFGLNEERGSDAVVLYTSANGASTRTSSGVELLLARADDTSAWLPLRVDQTYKARVRQVRNDGDAPLTNDLMVLSLGPKIASQVSEVKPGDVVTLSTGTSPDMSGSPSAIGGGPALVHGHRAQTFHGLQPRHPRTAIGWNSDFFFLVEVDGRQRESVGMSFPELADYMVKIGCDEALNLDGGGSATLWAYGTVMNNPSEGHERPAANALVIVRKNKQ